MRGLGYSLGGVIAVCGIVLVVLGLGPLGAILTAASVGALLVLMLRPPRATLILFSVALLAAVIVPFTRLTGELDQIKFIVPGAILASAILVLARTGAQIGPLAWGCTYFLFYGVATTISPDLSEWAVYAAITAVGLSGIILGGQITRLGLWSQARTMIIAVATAAAVYAVIEAAFALPPLWQGAKIFDDGTSAAQRSELIPGLMRAQATFGHALVLVFLLLIALALVLREMKLGRARVWLTIALLAGVVASGSRGGLIVAAALVVFQAGRATWAGRAPIMMTVAGIAVAATAPVWVPAFDAFMSTGSFTHRFGAFEAGLRLMTQREPINVWFGDGAASTPRLYAEGILFTDGLTAIDNQLVLSLAEVGIVGVALLAVIVAIALKQASPGVRVALIVAIVEFGSFDALVWPMSALIFWTLIGAAMSATPTTEKAEKPPAKVALPA